MKKLIPYLSVAAILIVTVLSGWVQGNLSNRWGHPADWPIALEKLSKLEKTLKVGVGEWQLVKTEPMHEQVEEILETPGYINGTFANSVTGETVNAFIVMGPPGPISVHKPEICYSSQDYDIKGKRKSVTIGKEDDPLGTFWALTMRSRDVNADMLRVYYAWGNSQNWQAVESPRISFGGDPLLYKMQLAAYLPPGADIKTQDTCHKFLEAVLPVVNAALLK